MDLKLKELELPLAEHSAVGSFAGLFFRQLRPKQWTKNGLVFAALLFSLHNVGLLAVGQAVAAYFLFSFISGCVYILNDYVDLELDRSHPVKRLRPMASGALNPPLTLALGCVLLLTSLIASYWIHPGLTLVLALYFALNVSYSFKLKHVVILDMMIIAAGFVLRAIAGGLAIGVSLTPWFLLCTMLLSLFLAIGKRRQELFHHRPEYRRKVLDNYSFPLLDQMTGIVATATIITYSLFTFSAGRTTYLMRRFRSSFTAFSGISIWCILRIKAKRRIGCFWRISIF